MGARRASMTAVAAVLGGVLLLLLLVTWAASIGPDEVLRGDGPQAQAPTPSASATSVPPEPQVEDDGDGPSKPGDDLLLRGIALLLQALVAVAALFVLYRVARWAAQKYDGGPRRKQPPVEVDFEVLEAPERLADEMRRDAAEQRVVLIGGAPRNAIVEAWHRFELQATAAGLSREEWETSSEFTLRMLDLVSADLSAVGRLAVLYREARFSDHELGEADRATALEALDAIHSGLSLLTVQGLR